MEQYIIEKAGNPFCGKMLEQVVDFLEQEGLEYDQGITHSYVLEDETGIFATGSVQGKVLKCIAVTKSHQERGYMTRVVTYLLEYLAAQRIGHVFVFTKPDNKTMFTEMGFYPIVVTKQILFMENRKYGISGYLRQLITETEKALGPGWAEKEDVGAIIANSNPFTKGHRYLIEKAAGKCQVLHVFVLSEDSQMFSAAERFEMVRAGIANLPNVILHKTSDYLISPSVFPTYFIKEKAKAQEFNSEIDIQIFCTWIAKELHIKKRFVGSEPNCRITNMYNEYMKQFLPRAGIELIIYQRKQLADQVISATTVRDALQKKQYETVKSLVPLTTWSYLLSQESVPEEE